MPAPERRAQPEDRRWEKAYQELLPKVFHYFAYRVGDTAIAEDLTSETLTRAWRARSRYREDLGEFTWWVFGVARNVSKEHFRNSRHPTEALDDPATPQDRPSEEAVIQRENFDRLAGLLAELTNRERDLIAMKYGAELTNRQIAEITKLSESNVGTILHRVIGRLRAQWEDEHER